MSNSPADPTGALVVAPELNRASLALHPADAEAEREIGLRSFLSVDINPYVDDNGTIGALQECLEVLNCVTEYFSHVPESDKNTHAKSTLESLETSHEEHPSISLQSRAEASGQTQQLAIPPSPDLTRLPSIDPYRLAVYCAHKARIQNPSLSPFLARGIFPKLIESHAQMRHVTVLVISGCYQLQSVPVESIRVFGSILLSLDLSYNALATFPAELCRGLPALESINLSNNRLRFLPAEIATLKKLEVLNVEGNQLAAFPCELRYLQGLRQLFVGSNPIVREQEVEEVALMQEAAQGVQVGQSVSPGSEKNKKEADGDPLEIQEPGSEERQQRERSPQDEAVSQLLSEPRPGIPSANRMLDDLLMLEIKDRRRKMKLEKQTQLASKEQGGAARLRPGEAPPYVDYGEDGRANPAECCLCKKSLLGRYLEALEARSSDSQAKKRRTLPYVLINFEDFLGIKSLPFAFCVCGDTIISADAQEASTSMKADPLALEKSSDKVRRKIEDCGVIVVKEIFDAIPVNLRKLDYSNAK